MVRGRMHGIARYALELARRLPALAPDLSFLGLTAPEGLPSDLGALTPSIPLRRARAGFLAPLKEQPTLLMDLLELSPDLFHATSFSLPGLWNGKLVATLHDANHLALPENYSPVHTLYYRLIVRPRAKRASALLTVSEFSREELAKYLDLTPYRFQVIAPGVDAQYQPLTRSQAKDFIQRRRLPERYLAAVGNPKAHKNLGLLAKLAPQLPLPIVLLAGKGAARELGFPDTTVELTELPEDEMPLFYGAAEALLLPSRYEGFGLPALEAMAAGCPVIASNVSALPEVTGEAAILVPPDDLPAWNEAVLRLLRDDLLRRSLVEKGRERVSRYTWEDCARRTLAVYRRVLEKSPTSR
ncbi:MAG: glycosyltransferase family 4 protein [Hyalangium sp.]|uniref:glycosyltransferase family 4 protein n=1 Tax=Hyalangium sp. TaxID=2028555 RepID=UPI00389B0CD2